MKKFLLALLLLATPAHAGRISDSDIAANANIQESKLAGLSTSRVACTDAGGHLVGCTTPSTYLDPTSSIQTQLNAKQAALGYTPLNVASNLSDVSSVSGARANLGLGTAAIGASTDFVQTNTASSVFTAGALNKPAVAFVGSPITGGTAATNWPLVYLGDSATSSAFSTLGTYLLVNAKSSFTGKLLDLQTNSHSFVSFDYRGQVRFNNVNDDALGLPMICSNIGGTVGNENPYCVQLYQNNSGIFSFYVLGADQGADKPLGFNNHFATIGVAGGVGLLSSFTSSTTPMLMVQNGAHAAYNANPMVGLVLKAGQTGPMIKSYDQNLSASTFSVDVSSNLTAHSVQLTATDPRPTCDVAHRGVFWVVPSATGVQDTAAVCAKDAADSYAWRTIY